MAIDKYKVFEKVGYTPHSLEQMSIHESEARFKIPICGRRFGKSNAAAYELLADCFQPDTYWWICGPTYKLAEKEFRILRTALQKKMPEIAKECRIANNVKQGDMRIEFPWNAIVECTSAQNQDSLLGEGLDGVIMSEAARHSRETWEQYIEPALSDKRGKAMFPTTPQGYNWLYGMYQIGQMPDQPEYESWRFPTWTNKIMYPGGYDDPEMVRIRNTVSDTYWSQEYAAEFVVFEGQIYTAFRPDIHVKKIEYNPAWRNYLALDFGFADPFVCLDIMVDPHDNCYVWREYQKRHMNTGQHGEYLINREQPEGYHIDGVFADPRGSDEISTLRPFLGAIHAPNVPWEQGIESVQRLIKLRADGRPGMYFDVSCVETVRQLQGLMFKKTKEGFNTKEGQHDYDDHGPDALRYFTGPFFVLGARSSLASVYDPRYLGSEAESVFTTRTQITLDTPVTYG